METKRIIIRMCEVCQQDIYLNEEKIKDALITLSDKISKYCYILHDKDKMATGVCKTAHFHIFLQFNKNTDVKTVAKAFDIKENYVKKIMAGSYNAAIPYLIHANAPDKFQYDVEEVKANFDYKKAIENYKNKTNGTKRLDEIKEQIESGIIREYNVNDYVTMEEYAKYKIIIERCLEYQRNIMAKKKITKEVIFMTGDAGTGKTTFAVDWAKNQGLSCFVSGSSNDPFDNYKGEDVVVLDDLRGSVFTLTDLLKILDNNTNTLVKSRYYNKILNCQYIIITSVKEIDDFYQNVFEHEDEPIQQLKRRCKTYMKFDKATIEIYSYNKDTGNYDFQTIVSNPNENLTIQKEEDNATSNKICQFFHDDFYKKAQELLLKPLKESGEEITHFPDISDENFFELVEKINEKEEEKTLSLKTPPEVEIYNLTFDEIKKTYTEVSK